MMVGGIGVLELIPVIQLGFFGSVFSVGLEDTPYSIETGNPITGGDYCEFDKLEARCPENHVIVMETAKYGRMKRGKCVVADLGYIGCAGNVLDLADRKCSGKQECRLQIPDEIFSGTNTCLAELKSYLEATYSCLKVARIPSSTPCTRCDYVLASPPSGYIASYTTTDTGCGQPDCPWRMEALPGQTLNITLVNFNWTLYQRHSLSAKPTPIGHNLPCKVYATIKDVSDGSIETICGGESRIQHVYYSQSHAVTLRIMGMTHSYDDTRHFLFKYEALGCPDVPEPIGGWVKRSRDQLIIGCHHNAQEWVLNCKGNSWDGVIPQTCSGGKAGTGAATSNEVAGLRLPYGLSIAVVALVAVLVGAIILVIGLVIVHRKYTRRPPNTHYSMPRDLPLYKDKHYSPGSIKAPPHPAMLKQVCDQSPTPGVDSYAHIWERPLPEPETVDPSACVSSVAYHQQYREHSVPSYGSESNDYNTVGSESYCTGTGEADHRSHTGLVYGNNTMARREVETPPVVGGDEPRYFAVDPGRERHHSLG